MAYFVELISSDKNNGILKFSDYGIYFLTWDFPKANFRVGVPTGASDGIYYITWSISEKPFSDGIKLYGNPQKTRVQIFMSNKIKIRIGDISNAVPGFGTFLIELNLNGFSPFSDIYVEFILITTDAEYPTFSPNLVEFTNIDTVKYFYINTSEVVNYGQRYEFTCILSGNDAESFEIDGKEIFYVDYITKEQPSITMMLDILSQTEADLIVDVGTDSIVYWAVVS